MQETFAIWKSLTLGKGQKYRPVSAGLEYAVVLILLIIQRLWLFPF